MYRGAIVSLSKKLSHLGFFKSIIFLVELSFVCFESGPVLSKCNIIFACNRKCVSHCTPYKARNKNNMI